MNKFRHPTVTSGQLNHGDDSFAIVDGVIECPDSIARELGLIPIAAAAPAGNSGGGNKDDKGDKGADTQIGIAAGNADKAKEAIAAAETVEALDALTAEEATRKDGVRVSVTRAIADRRAEIEAAKQ